LSRCASGPTAARCAAPQESHRRIRPPVATGGTRPHSPGLSCTRGGNGLGRPAE
jgi:hypothetical protein